MATNSDTMIEGLKSLVSDLAQMKLLPDADPTFLDQLEQQIIMYVRQAGQQQINGAMGQQAPAGGMGNPGGMGDATMGMGFGQAQQIGPGGGAGFSGLAPQQPPNADELQRILQGPTG